MRGGAAGGTQAVVRDEKKVERFSGLQDRPHSLSLVAMSTNLIITGRGRKAPTSPPDPDVLGRYADRLLKVADLAMKGVATSGDVRREMMNLLRAAQYNFIYLAPFFYPQYLPSKTAGNSPLQFSRRPYMRDIMAFNPGGKSVTAGSRQLGKSTAAAAHTDMSCSLLPDYSALYVAPRPDHVKTFADKFKLLADQNILNKGKRKRGLRHNLYYREYENRSWAKFIYCLTTANNARGNTCHKLDIDEGQGFDGSLEPELLQVIRRSPLPTYTIGGTALSKDTFLEAHYQASSQGTYIHTCHACGADNDMGDPDHALRMIRPRGLQCRKCDALLPPNGARLVHRHMEELEVGNIGIRVPQTAIADIVTSTREWLDIVHAVAVDPNKALQEVLGIPVEDGARELTRDDLKSICDIPDGPVDTSKYRFVFSGCDWGGSDYNPMFKLKASNTAHVIYGLTSEGKRDILHLGIHSGKDYNRVIADILRAHELFGGTHMGSDMGMGMLYNNLIRMSGKISGNRHFVIQYGGNPGRVVAPMQTPGAPPNYFVAHRTETLSALFSMIRKPAEGQRQVGQRFHCFSWEKAEPYLEEFLNIHRDLQETASGSNLFKYRKHGSKTDDIVHALNFAHIAESIVTGQDIVSSTGILETMALETAMTTDLRMQLMEAMDMHRAREDWNPHAGYDFD